MIRMEIADLLEQVKNGQISVEEAERIFSILDEKIRMRNSKEKCEEQK